MRKVSALCAVLLLQNSCSWFAVPAAWADPVNLDLSSTARTVPASALGTPGSVAIRTPQGVSVIRGAGGTLLTPAQFAAAQQVLATGRQSLGLGVGGNAVAGRFSAAGGTSLSGLVIPSNVTMLQNFASGALKVTGNITNVGNLYACSNNDAVRSAVISATSIRNLPQGTISAIVPQSILNSAGIARTVPNLALILNASTSIQNEGRITADGAVSLNTPSVSNHGLIASSHSDVNFDSATDLRLDNARGAISAVQGSINFRTPDFTAKKDLTISGGTLAAAQVNFNSGDGHVKVDVDEISGETRVRGGTAAVTTHGGNLNLGEVSLTGDPTFYNTQGDVTINSDLTFPGAAVAIIASRNILISGQHAIDTHNPGAGNGGDVTLIAGANVSSTGSASASGDTASTVTVSGASPTGGSILLNSSPTDFLTSINSKSGSQPTDKAGNVTLLAFGRVIDMGSASVDASAADNSSVVMAAAPGNLSLGSITASSIGIQTGQPALVGGNPVQYINGQRTAGNFGFASATTTGNISTGSIQTTNGGAVTIKTDGTFAANGAISLDGVGTADGGALNIDSLAGFQAYGPISALGGALGGNGGSVIIGAAQLTGLQLSGHSIRYATLNGNPINVSAQANGNGGTISIWADTVGNGQAGQGSLLSAIGATDSLDVKGGSVTVVTKDGITIGNNLGAGEFVVQAFGDAQAPGVRADGGTARLFSLAARDVTINGNLLDVGVHGDPSNSGDGGTIEIVALPSVPTHSASDGFFFDTYGGAVSITNSLNMGNLNTGKNGTFVIEANSMKPVTLTNTRIDASQLYITNLAPGGVVVQGAVTLQTGTADSADLNISASKLSIDASLPNQLTINPDGIGASSKITLATTNPSNAGGDIHIGTGPPTKGIVVLSNAGGANTSLSVIAGGNLIDDIGGITNITSGSLLLSAGLVPDTVSYPTISGTTTGAPPQITDANMSSFASFGLQRGSLKVEGSFSLTGNNIKATFLSNSLSLLDVGNSSSSSNFIHGTVSVQPGFADSLLPNLIVANFGNGINVGNGTVATTSLSGAGGVAVNPQRQTTRSLPIPVGAGAGVLEFITPGALNFIGNQSGLAQIGDSAGAGTHGAGGSIYISAGQITTTQPVNLDAHSLTGDGGDVFVKSGGNIVVSNTALQVDVRGATNAGESGDAGQLTMKGSTITYNTASALVSPGTMGGAGAKLDLQTTGSFNNFVRIIGSLNLDANGADGGTYPAGSLNFVSSSLSSFLLDPASTNGITGSFSAADSTGAQTGALNITGLRANNFSVNFSSPIANPISATSEIGLSVHSPSNLLIQNAIAYQGNVLLQVDTGSLTVAPGAKIFSSRGDVTLQNLDTASPTASIVIGNGATITASSSTAPRIVVAIGSPTTNAGGSIPGTTIEQFNFGQVAVSGPNISATGAADHTFIGAYNIANRVDISNQNTNGGRIEIQQSGSAVTRLASFSVRSLDLADSNARAELQLFQDHQIIGGNLAITKDVILPAYSNVRDIQGLGVPSGYSITFDGINPYRNIQIDVPFTTQQTVINGDLKFSGADTTGYIRMEVKNDAGPSRLIMGPNAKIMSEGDLRVEIVGLQENSIDMHATAAMTAARTLDLGIAGGGTIGILDAPFIRLQGLDSGSALLRAPGATLTANEISITSRLLGTPSNPFSVVMRDTNLFKFALAASEGFSGAGLLNVSTTTGHFVPLSFTTATGQGGTINLTSDSSVFMEVGNLLGPTVGAFSVISDGFFGTVDRPVNINVSTLKLIAGGSVGGVHLNNGSNATLLPSHSTLDFSLTAPNVVLADLDVTAGDIKIFGSSSLVVAPNSTITTSNGSIDLQSGLTGTIDIGSGVTLGALNNSGGPANVFVHRSPTILLFDPTPPANVTVTENNGGQVLFAFGITASPPDNRIFASGANALVAFDTSGGAPSTINLGGNVMIVAGTNFVSQLRLSSLDLTNAVVSADINGLQSTGIIGGDATHPVFRPINFQPTVSAFNVPAGFSPVFQDFNSQTPVIVNLTGASTTLEARIDGSVTAAPGSSLNLVVNGDNGAGHEPFQMGPGGNLAGDVVTVTAERMLLNGSAMIVGKSLSLVTHDLSMQGSAIFSANLLVSSPSSLIVQGSGSTRNIVGNNAIFRADGGDLTLQNPARFDTDLTLQASGNVVLQGAPLLVNGTANVAAQNLILNNQSIESRGLSFVSPTGKGTIMNPFGDVVLPANISSPGQNLAILALGNIVAAGAKVTSIDLSSKTTNGGSLTLIAGFNFNGAASSNTPVAGTFDIGAPTAAGGSILLPSVKINTSSSALGKSAGRVTAIASGGTDNAGSIILGNITAAGTAKDGQGGSVLAIGDGGIITGAISTSGPKGAGSVELFVAKPIQFGGTVQVTDGALTGSGVWSRSDLAPRLNGAAVRTGDINTSSTLGRGGNVQILSELGVKVGKVNTRGLVNLSTGAKYGASGNLLIVNPFGAVTTGGITTFGLPATKTTVAVPLGGDVDIFGTSIKVGGSIDAHAAGNVSLQTALDSAVRSGPIVVTGGISSAGGGDVSVAGGTISIGTLGGLSVNAGPLTGSTLSGIGEVDLQTSSEQELPAAFDLTSTKSTIAAFPGALFTLAAGAPVNGLAGSIRTNVVTGKKELNGTGLLFADASGLARFNPNSGADHVSISIFGKPTNSITLSDASTLNIDVADSKGKRTTIRPDVAGALFLTTHGQSIAQATNFAPNPDLTLTNASSLIVDQTRLPVFTAFNLPANVSLTITGPSALLKLPTTTSLKGPITFADAGNHTIDFGAGSPVIGGGITMAGGTGNLILASTGAKMTVASLITAPNVVLARATASALTFTTTGGAANGVDAPIVLSHSVDQAFAVNFVSKGADFIKNGKAVTFGNVPVTTQLDALAVNGAKQYAARPIANLSFSLFDASSGPIAPHIDGRVSASTITLKSTEGIIVDATADLRADKTFTLTARTNATIGGTITTSAGNIKITNAAKAGGTITLASPTMTATGGNVIVLSDGNVDQSGALISISAQASGTKATNQKGGGVEIGAGATVSAIAPAFLLKAGTRPVTANYGAVSVVPLTGTPSGALQTIFGKTPGTIDLAAGTINLSGGGVVVLQGQNGKSVQLDNINITTTAFKPIAYRPSPSGFDAILNPSEDSTVGTAFGDIEIRKGAIVSVSREANAIRITALSGPGDVVIRSGSQKLLVAPAHEVLLTSAEAEAQLAKADGVGRRNATRAVLTNGVVVHRCEVSLVTFMSKAAVQSRAVREKMLKTAAAVYLVSGSKHGAFTARR